jgi:uncharacterized protein YndB with AHSA1/START domain
MLEAALREYAILVQRNPSFSAIVFHTLTGFIIASLLYVIVNIGSQSPDLLRFSVSVPHDRHHLLLMPVVKWGLFTEVTVQAKALEFLVLVSLSIALTASAAAYMRRSSLRDALSPIRKRLMGTWDLTLEDFAENANARRDFKCKVEFGETEAKKLRVKFFESSELELNGSTPLIALYVPEGADKPDSIIMSFPVQGETLKAQDAGTMLYWLQMTYLAFQPNKQIEFTGQWHQITVMDSEYRVAGVAKLSPSQASVSAP